jgi:hypothetical protein
MHRGLCCCNYGIIALIALAPLPRLHGRCIPYCADLFALILHWRHYCHYTGVVAPVNLACLRCCASIITLVTLELLPLIRWHYSPHCAGLFALVVLALHS